MLTPWSQHVELWAQQDPPWAGGSRARSRWWKFAAMSLALGVIAAGGALALGRVAPDYEAIVMLGPFPSGKVRVILWAVAVSTLALAALTSLTIAGVRPGMSFSKVVMVLSWIAAIPLLGFFLLFTALDYYSQPEIHKFTVGGHDYILTSQIGFLIAADDTYLHLYRKEGRTYRQTGARLTTADTLAFDHAGFSLDRQGRNTWLVYTDAGNSTRRVRVP